jgi:hypothetical protein
MKEHKRFFCKQGVPPVCEEVIIKMYLNMPSKFTGNILWVLYLSSCGDGEVLLYRFCFNGFTSSLFLLPSQTPWICACLFPFCVVITFFKEMAWVFYILQNKRTISSSSLKKIQNQRTGSPSYFKNCTRSYGFHGSIALLCPVIWYFQKSWEP